MNTLRLVWLFFRLGILNELEYRTNFYIQVFQSVLSLATTLARLAVIFALTETLGGWRPSELTALVGVYFVVRGAVTLVIQPSMQRLMEDVRQGTLDFTLTKPEDAQLLVSVRQANVWKLVEVILGAGVLVVALAQLRATLGWPHALAFVAALVAGAAIVYSFLLILATLSFWFVRIENILHIYESMYEAGRWPVGIYPRWLQFALTSLVPVAFAVTVPAEALTQRLTAQTLLGALALATALLLGSRWFWNSGVKRYSGASA